MLIYLWDDDSIRANQTHLREFHSHYLGRNLRDNANKLNCHKRSKIFKLKAAKNVECIF